MKSLSLFVVLLALMAACNDSSDDDSLTLQDCSDLLYQIYDECSLTMPMVDGEYPDLDEAQDYCEQDQFYDWPCVDECIFHNKGLCMSIKLCLENCG